MLCLCPSEIVIILLLRQQQEKKKHFSWGISNYVSNPPIWAVEVFAFLFSFFKKNLEAFDTDRCVCKDMAAVLLISMRI